MVLAGESRITEIVVIGDGAEPLTPCGACRQRLGEFSFADTKVHCANLEGIKATYRLDELLPHAFRPSVLRKT
jgi:cytidine deaminase